MKGATKSRFWDWVAAICMFSLFIGFFVLFCWAGFTLILDLLLGK